MRGYLKRKWQELRWKQFSIHTIQLKRNVSDLTINNRYSVTHASLHSHSLPWAFMSLKTEAFWQSNRSRGVVRKTPYYFYSFSLLVYFPLQNKIPASINYCELVASLKLNNQLCLCRRSYLFPQSISTRTRRQRQQLRATWARACI